MQSSELCCFKGCGKPAWCKGWCNGHYRQARCGEEMRPLQQQFHGLPERDRFMQWVGKQPSGCWHWLGSLMKKANKRQYEWHGQWRNAAGQIELTHRAAWRMFKGPIPRKAFVLHTCDNPRCVNVEHLYLGTQQNNMSDMWERKRAAPGVSLGVAHGMAKLTEKEVLEIRQSALIGREIAAQYGISTTTVYDIKNRRIWRHLK